MMVVIIRLLILAAIAWFGYRLVRKLLVQLPPAAGPETGNRPDSPDRAPEAMQRCAHCGVHVPVGESTQSRGQLFCSEGHRDAWFRDHPQ